jgi:hypothetical protein
MNMDSNAQRQGPETCDWISRSMENLCRLRAHEEGRLLVNLTTPHPAGSPQVRNGLKNRVLNPTDRHPTRHTAAEWELASERQSLALASQIW